MSLIVIDTSVWSRLRKPEIAAAVTEAIGANAVAMSCCFTSRPLIAAAAESIGAEVWHCDRDYELIAEVTSQQHRRFAA